MSERMLPSLDCDSHYKINWPCVFLSKESGVDIIASLKCLEVVKDLIVLLNPVMPCLCKKCRSRSVGF